MLHEELNSGSCFGAKLFQLKFLKFKRPSKMAQDVLLLLLLSLFQFLKNWTTYSTCQLNFHFIGLFKGLSQREKLYMTFIVLGNYWQYIRIFPDIFDDILGFLDDTSTSKKVEMVSLGFKLRFFMNSWFGLGLQP